MRLLRTSVSALAGATVGVLTLLVTLGARADKPLGLQSLTGTYHFAVIQIRQASPDAPLVYCNEYGRIAFDGAGAGEFLDGYGYGVCSNGENPVQPQTFTYEVDPAGSMLLTDQIDFYTTHCQILDKGALLLCDGTGGLGGSRRPGLLTFMATVSKL